MSLRFAYLTLLCVCSAVWPCSPAPTAPRTPRSLSWAIRSRCSSVRSRRRDYPGMTRRSWLRWARLLPCGQLRQLQLLVSPRTLLRWHADLVRRRWTYTSPGAGRPGTAQAVRTLVLDEYIDHHDMRRPHRSLHQDPPAGSSYPPALTGSARVVRRVRLGGLTASIPRSHEMTRFSAPTGSWKATPPGPPNAQSAEEASCVRFVVLWDKLLWQN